MIVLTHPVYLVSSTPRAYSPPIDKSLIDRYYTGGLWRHAGTCTLARPDDQHARTLPPPRAGVMVAASTWRPRQPSFEGTNVTDQTSNAPAARTPGPAREMVRQPFFLKRETPRRPPPPHTPSQQSHDFCSSKACGEVKTRQED